VSAGSASGSKPGYGGEAGTYPVVSGGDDGGDLPPNGAVEVRIGGGSDGDSGIFSELPG